VQNFRRGFAYTAWAIAENNALKPWLRGGEKFQKDQADAYFRNNEALKERRKYLENPFF
jgi:hypothetical protein